MNVTGVLLDSRGIQNYIFSSNTLKINIGASILVQKIYDQKILEIINNMDLKITEDLQDFNEGYSLFQGGGNAILLFSSRKIAEELVFRWTTELLQYAPGLQTSVTIVCAEIDFDDPVNYKLELKEKIVDRLYDRFNREKDESIPIIESPSFGITDRCIYSGLVTDFVLPLNLISDKNNKLVISSQVGRKLKIHNENTSYWENRLNFKGNFSEDLNEIAKFSHNNTIAICHIDGNSIGEIFTRLNSIDEYKDLSHKLKKITEDSFKELIKEFQNEVKSDPLPLRPIIIGGDDVTFVTIGNLGIWASDLFIKALSLKAEKELKNFNLNEPLTASAGIGIVKYKYPFFRGYQLAEQLCDNAKVLARNHGGSWLDFQVVLDQFPGNLDDYRKQFKHIRDRAYQLLWRPYLINNGIDISLKKYNLDNFIDKSVTLFQTDDTSKSKLYQIRKLLGQSIDQVKLFIEYEKRRREEGSILPNLDNCNDQELFSENTSTGEYETPFFDLIDIYDYTLKGWLDKK